MIKNKTIRIKSAKERLKLKSRRLQALDEKLGKNKVVHWFASPDDNIVMYPKNPNIIQCK